jgi:hypothetical protein
MKLSKFDCDINDNMDVAMQFISVKDKNWDENEIREHSHKRKHSTFEANKL